MINLNSILQSAQGGEAVHHLSARFGLSPEQTQSAIDALLPALQMGLQNKVETGGIGALFGHGETGVHRDAYGDPAAAQSDATAASGSSVLGELFGGVLTQVVQQAAQRSGVPASIVQAMLPVIVSMIMGGLMHGAQNGAFGGILSSVLGAVLGQHGTTAAQAMTAPAPAARAEAPLDEISRMFDAGTPPAPEHQAQLASLLGR